MGQVNFTLVAKLLKALAKRFDAPAKGAFSLALETLVKGVTEKWLYFEPNPDFPWLLSATLDEEADHPAIEVFEKLFVFDLTKHLGFYVESISNGFVTVVYVDPEWILTVLAKPELTSLYATVCEAFVGPTLENRWLGLDQKDEEVGRFFEEKLKALAPEFQCHPGDLWAARRLGQLEVALAGAGLARQRVSAEAESLDALARLMLSYARLFNP